MATVAQQERQLRRDMETELNRLLNSLVYWGPSKDFMGYSKMESRVESLKERSRELDKTRLD